MKGKYLNFMKIFGMDVTEFSYTPGFPPMPLYVTARQLGYTEMLLALSEKATEDQNLEHMRRELFSIVIGQMRKNIKSNSTTAQEAI